ncbi:MAG TPA: hypothetical protein VGB22_02800 [candidate division Zixibacteria bacterium]|jgi:hypothetical protein
MDQAVNYARHERVWLREHPELNEKWIQARIAEDPSILGLGDLVLKDKERIQPRAGRLDLLLHDVDADRRYEVEVQLGQTDESHIVRTIEYWDIERKRYPQYDHCAVIVAEDITSRFLNVIGLFNGSIPLIAIQLYALRLDDQVALVFTTVLEELSRGFIDEDDGAQEPADRGYWESRASRNTLEMTDQLLAVLRQWDPKLELKYNKYYIGLAKNGTPDNFVVFRPKREFLQVEARLPRSEGTDRQLEDTGLDLMPYNKKWGKYRIRLTRLDLEKHHELVAEILKRAHDNRT